MSAQYTFDTERPERKIRFGRRDCGLGRDSGYTNMKGALTLMLVELRQATAENLCKLCDRNISIDNTTLKGLIADLCDRCWRFADHDCP